MNTPLSVRVCASVHLRLFPIYACGLCGLLEDKTSSESVLTNAWTMSYTTGTAARSTSPHGERGKMWPLLSPSIAKMIETPVVTTIVYDGRQTRNDTATVGAAEVQRSIVGSWPEGVGYRESWFRSR